MHKTQERLSAPCASKLRLCLADSKSLSKIVCLHNDRNRNAVYVLSIRAPPEGLEAIELPSILLPPMVVQGFELLLLCYKGESTIHRLRIQVDLYVRESTAILFEYSVSFFFLDKETCSSCWLHIRGLRKTRLPSTLWHPKRRKSYGGALKANICVR